MTQFMLCVPAPAGVRSKLKFRPISEDEPWLREAARALFPNTADVRVPQLDSGASISDLFTAAHNAVHNGRGFNSTQLQSVLPEMMNACESFVLWWGDEWSDLPVITTETALRAELEEQLEAAVGDVYLRWKPEAR